MSSTLSNEKQLLRKDIIHTTMIVCILFAVLLTIFWLVEALVPTLKGEFLQWRHIDYYFSLVGSLIGVIYVLLIRNPKDYLGYLFGIAMSVCLSLQFALQGQYDLVVLYLCVFVPIQACTFVSWRKNLVTSINGQPAELHPAFMDTKHLLLTILVGIAIWFADYIIVALLHGDALWENVLLRTLSALMIASSCLANYLLLFQKTESWFCWVLFCIVGIVFNYLIGSYFTAIFFIVSAVVNGKALVEWVRISK